MEKGITDQIIQTSVSRTLLKQWRGDGDDVQQG